MQPLSSLASQILFWFVASLVIGFGYNLGRILVERAFGK